MARVQLVIPDEDKERFIRQARGEGLTFSAWLRAAASDRLEAGQREKRFVTSEDVDRFFLECDARRGPGMEPDWEEHKRAIEASRLHGLPNT